MMNPGKVASYAMRNGEYRISRGGLRPTSASCEITDEYGEQTLIGKCHRAEWYRLHGIEATNPPSDIAFVKFQVGRDMETGFQELWKNQGVLLDSNVLNYGAVPFDFGDDSDKDKEMIISGESDALLWMHECDGDGKVTSIDRSKAVGLEMKTTRNYYAIKEITGRGNKLYPTGKPKMEHIMQVAMYLLTKEKHEKHYGVEIPYYIIYYLFVDSGDSKQFKVSLSKKGEVIVTDIDDKPIVPDPAYTLDTGIAVNPWSGLTIDNITKRYAELMVKLEGDAPPDRDHVLRYDEATAKHRFETGQLSKTKHNEWLKKPLATVGDWQCGWCDFRDHCYPCGVLTPDVESGLLTVDDAMKELGYDA